MEDAAEALLTVEEANPGLLMTMISKLSSLVYTVIFYGACFFTFTTGMVYFK